MRSRRRELLHQVRAMRRHIPCAFSIVGLALVSVASAAAQPATPRGAPLLEQRIFADRTYDSAIPAPSATVGYALGQHLATYDVMIPYFERLAASSRRVTVATHGVSSEGRPIYHVTISAPENMARLEEIRANLARLADPRTLAQAELEAIVGSTPVVVMLVFATDGAETAGPEAAMQVAYQLAAGTDARTVAMLQDAVVIIVPAENPDSNQRTVAWYNAFRVGAGGTSDPDAAEHQFPWGINSNNRYQIDPNRESVWSTQRETRAMVALYRRWNPQVFVDNHGEHPVYTGTWYVEPLHEVLTANQRAWHRRFGEAIMPVFAQHSYTYRPWEFGQFDPGYWDTYPNFSGAIAWTTETTGGGGRGLRVERRDGPPYTLADGIIQHMIASDVTIAVAAQNREQLLRDFVAYKRSAIEEGQRGPVRAYAISAANDAARIATVVNTLRRNAIDVHRTTRELPVSGARAYFQPGGDRARAPRAVTLPAGSYIVSLAQPESRMARVLLEHEARFSEAFLQQIAKARADTARSGGRLFYDITAWSMPLTYQLAAYELAEPLPPAALARVTEDMRPRGEVVHAEARHAFVIDYATNAAIHAIARLRREGVAYRIAPAGFMVAGRPFASGSALVFHSENAGRDLTALAHSVAQESGVTVVGIDGPTSEGALRLEPASLLPAVPGRIAVVMDRPVSPNSYGHIWYTFEQLYGVEFTALGFDRLASVDLAKYRVLILPDGNYGSVHQAVAGDIAAKLRTWVEQGGTLLGVRGGSAWIATERHGLTSARVRRPQLSPRFASVPGTIFRAVITDRSNPLAFGYDQPELPVMVWSALAFDAPASVEAPVRIAEAARAHVSGFTFPEFLPHLADTPYIMRERRGAGSVVLFLDDPNFRLFWDGLTRMFFNAVFLGGRTPRGSER